LEKTLTKKQKMTKYIKLSNTFALAAVAGAMAMLMTGCGSQSSNDTAGGEAGDEKIMIQNAGSDTMVNLAQAWAENYAKVNPKVSIEVSGGGSGTGIAALINGTTDIANCSRAMKDAEKKKAKDASGKDPKEHVMGYDALAVYVHKDCPLDEISLEQLAEIYGENGTITKWSQIGVTIPGCDSDEIIRVSRQSSSGTFAYFREAVLGKERDYKLGSRDMHGSKEVVELVQSTPCAIGYSGMGYATPDVKMLKIAKSAGEPSYAPNVENTIAKTYPIARPLFIYSLGEPEGALKEYIDWCFGAEGQKIVTDSGYVSLAQ
jgi:phosphate transport system substrate-binding protein